MQNQITDNALIVIPARMESQRFPGKPMANILGEPMILHTARHAALTGAEVLLATDSALLGQYLTEQGFNVYFSRKKCICGTDRVGEAIFDYPDKSIIVNLQCDEPAIHPSDIINLIEVASTQVMSPEPMSPVYTLVTKLTDEERGDPDIVKAYTTDGNTSLGFSRCLPSKSDIIWRHVGVYAYTRDTLELISGFEPTREEKETGLEQLRWIDHGVEVRPVICQYPSFSVDRPEDLAKVAKIL